MTPDTNPPYILLITGSRTAGLHQVWDTLGGVMRRNGKPAMVIHGGARGADEQAGEWATMHEIPVVVVPALWDSEGKVAGVRRNQRMLNLALTLVAGSVSRGEPVVLRAVAFPGASSRGTIDMIKRVRAADVPVLVRPVGEDNALPQAETPAPT